MKRRTIITSVLVIVLCLGLISGSTFALFTSESKVNIAVTSGKVNVVATLKDLAVYSANANASELTADEKADKAGTLTGTFAGTYYYDQLSVENNVGFFANGGKATLSSNLLTLDKITPGDKVSVNVDVENNSNVAIQYRVRVNVLEDENAAESYKLFKGLKVTIGKDEAKKDLNSTILASEWTPLAAEAEIADIPVKIYLPLDAGNEYQGLTTKLLLTVEAVQGNANTSILAGINAKLTESPEKNATMYDAIQELASSYPYSILKEYVWSVDNDLFYVESDVESSFEYRFFKVYSTMPNTQTFSIYADPSWNTAEEVNLTVGFDAGVTTDITSITYNRSTAEYGQDVVIRTNSAGTTLTINAPKDTINHYGISGNVNIVAVAGSSYHENGKVAFVEITNGRLALEKDSQVSRVHFASTVVEQGQPTEDKVFNEIIVSYDKSLSNKLPEFSRDNVEIPTQGKLVVELQKVDNTQPEPEATSDFIWLTKQGIFEQIKVSEDGEKISEGAKWADDDDNVDDDTQKASFQIANNIGRDTNGDVSTNVTVNDVVYTVTLNEERELVVKDSGSNPVSANIVVEASGLSEEEKTDIKQKEIKKLTVNSIFADYLKIETVTGVDILPNKTQYGLKEGDIKLLYEENKAIFNNIYGVYYDEGTADDSDDDKLLLQNGRSYIAVDEDSYKQDNGKYQYWHGDFVISFNKDISAFDEENIGNNIILAGEYGDWGWLKFPLVDGLAANTKLRLLDSYMGGIITINYEELCTLVKTFKCGAAYIAPEGYDTSDPLIITIEFRLYETSDDPTTHNDETGNYEIVDTYQYIFSK